MEDQHVDDAAELELIRARLCAAAGQMAAAQCWWLDLVAECDERGAWFGYGVRDCAHWIAHSCSMSPGTAREHVRVARALRGMPLFHAEFAAGRLSYSKVREATRIADQVEESILLSLAKTCTASQFERTVRGFRRTGSARVEQEKRRKARWFTDDDGMVVLTARLPSEEGAILIAALKMAMDQLSVTRGDAGAGEPEPDPTMSAWAELNGINDPGRDHAPPVGPDPPPAPDPTVSCADALLQVAQVFLANSSADLSGEDRHLVVVHVDARLLADDHPATDDPDPVVVDPTDSSAVPASGACRIAGVGGISPGTAARLACDAVVVAMLRGPGGAVLALGRKRRLVSAHQRRVLMVRDGGCQFTGCVRTTHLEAHHIRSWAAGGKTDLDNMILLCRLHHMAIHDAGFSIAQAAEFRAATPHWIFADPSGRPLDDPPLPCDPDYPTAFPLSRELDHITRWTDAQAEHIRPGWRGEPVHITNIVAILQDNPRDGSRAA